MADDASLAALTPAVPKPPRVLAKDTLFHGAHVLGLDTLDLVRDV